MISDPIEIAKLKQSILDLRNNIFPPQNLLTVDGLPIYYGEKKFVDEYLAPFGDPIDLSEINEIHLPVHFNLPVFARNVTRMILNKTLAKESITFRSSADLFEKCGYFNREYTDLIYEYFDRDEDNSGLVLGYSEGWNSIEILDNRNNTRKQRSDAYTNPLAKNNTWFIYKKL